MRTDDSLEVLLDGFRRKGFRLAFRMLGNADDAADAVQEGLRAFWSHGGRLRPDQDPAAWFFKALRNQCIDQIRRRRTRSRTTLEPAVTVDPRAAEPADVMAQQEFRSMVARELDALDEPSREILLLRDYQQLSYAQIAEVLGISPGTVMSRLHRARMKLRERLKDRL